MSPNILYQWESEIARHLLSLNSWQVANVALLSYGVVKAKSSQQMAICQQLGEYGEAASLERRFQRFLSNDGVRVSAVCREWVRWVWQALGCPRQIHLLVDETKLSQHLGIMVLGIAYENRCIPLVWHCYQVNHYPRCGQVSLILNLLIHVKKALGDELDALVMADRGIGTSPDLCRYIAELLGWRYLFRVTCQSKIVTETGDYAIAQQVEMGQIWYASGKVFKKRGQLPARAIAIWTPDYDEPWALVTNDETLTGFEYAQRNWQEQSFRDLKSGGWHWNNSHVWLPQHARRLLLLLVVAYGWMVALGSYVFATGQQARPKTYADGRRERRYSVFREGLHFFYAMLCGKQAVRVSLAFASLTPPD
jgi:hypothetical protein